MIMVITVCATLCRDIEVNIHPMNPALCQMQHLTAQILIAPQLAEDERVTHIRCVRGIPV